MRITTTDYATGRTADGRQVTAMAGATLEADESDQDLVDLFRSFVAAGVAEVVAEDPPPAQDPPAPPAQDPPPPAKSERKPAASRSKAERPE